MSKPLRVLMVEDSKDDAALLVDALRKGGYEPAFERVDTAAKMSAALERGAWDVVIADYTLPGFSGLAALELLKSKRLDLPFIVVSGTISDEMAVNAMRAGAHDYMIKGNLARLAPAIAREMCDVVERQERRRTEAALWESQARLAGIIASAMDGIITIDERQRIVLFNAAAEQMFRCSAVAVIGETIDRFIPERFRRSHAEHIRKFGQTGVTNRRMGGLSGINGRRADGEEFPIEASISQAEAAGQKFYTVILRDISERRKAEEEIRKTTERLQTLSKQLLDVQETERRQIARELHDEIGQALTATKINLQAIQRYPDPASAGKRLDDCIGVVDRLLQQVRRLSLNLRPPLLDDLGLEPALRWYVEQQAERVGLKIELLADESIPRFDLALETACFRVAQEAVNNVVRHARAKAATVELFEDDGELHLIVRDDGIGFDMATVQQRAEGGASLGWLSMRERATLAGGRLECESKPGRGTRIYARFPLRKRDEP